MLKALMMLQLCCVFSSGEGFYASLV